MLTFSGFQLGSALVGAVAVAVEETAWKGVCAALLRAQQLLACAADLSASAIILTGRGSFRPVQSSLAKAAVSRPIVPKVLPPQATGPLASKSATLPDMHTRPTCGGPLCVGVGCHESRGLHIAPSPGAIDLAAKSAGIIPGSPLPVLDTDGLSGITPLSSDEVTAAVTGPDSTGHHQNEDPLPAVGVSVCRGLLPAATSSGGGMSGSSP